MNLELTGLIVAAIWLLVISLLLVKFYRHYRKLTHEVKKGSLIKVLDKVIENEAKNAGDLAKLKKELKKTRENAIPHIQKVGLQRFNPFSELGGDHSFSLALLDGNEDGIILTGLHTRERTRVYIKHIKKGKSIYELSKEEKKALTKAQKGK